jgi:hypothetical protein
MQKMDKSAAIEAAKVAAVKTGMHQEVFRSAHGGYDVHSRMHGQPIGQSTETIVAPDGTVTER